MMSTLTITDRPPQPPQPRHLPPSAFSMSGSESTTKLSAPSADTAAPTTVPTTPAPTPSTSLSSTFTHQAPSLFHQCQSVLDRLSCIDGFENYICRRNMFSHGQLDKSLAPGTPSTDTLDIVDPVQTLWNTFRLGRPLCDLYNILRPNSPIVVKSPPSSAISSSKSNNSPGGNPQQPTTCKMSIINMRKAQVFQFIVNCRNNLGFLEEQVFTITDLFYDDTNGFVKVIRTVELLLEQLEKEGAVDFGAKGVLAGEGLEDSANSPAMTVVANAARDDRRSSLRHSLSNSDSGTLTGDDSYVSPTDEKPISTSKSPHPRDVNSSLRQKVVVEFLNTERAYFNSLEQLQSYMMYLSKNEIISSDMLHRMFANLNALVDFQRRFLVGVEALVSGAKTGEERLGALFVKMEEGFRAYESFCANFKTATELILAETPTLQMASHIVEPVSQLPSLLIKPVQRICRYPLLLSELIKYSDPEVYLHYDELKEGLASIKRVNHNVNEMSRKVENAMVKEALEKRVEDWKNHDPCNFGSLLLHDDFVMAINDDERALHIYLFEQIILCCKEGYSSSLPSFGMRKKRRDEKKEERKVEIKGRIWMASVQKVLAEKKGAHNFSLKVFWKSHELESFMLKCQQEEKQKRWYTALEQRVSDIAAKKRTRSKSQPFNGPGQHQHQQQQNQQQEQTQQHQQHRHQHQQNLKGTLPISSSHPSLNSPFTPPSTNPLTPMSQMAKSMLNLNRTPPGPASSTPAGRQGTTSFDGTENGDDHHYEDNFRSFIDHRANNSVVEFEESAVYQGARRGTHATITLPEPLTTIGKGRASAPSSPKLSRIAPKAVPPGSPRVHESSSKLQQQQQREEEERQHRHQYHQTYPLPANQHSSHSQQLSLSQPSKNPTQNISPQLFSHYCNRIVASLPPELGPSSIPPPTGKLPPLPSGHNTPRPPHLLTQVREKSSSGHGRIQIQTKTQQQPQTPVGSPLGGAKSFMIKVKIHYRSDVYVIQVSRTITYQELLDKILKKIRLCGPQTPVPPPATSACPSSTIPTAHATTGTATMMAASATPSPDGRKDMLSQMTNLGKVRIKYQDEDNDKVIIRSDEDVQMAFENASAQPRAVDGTTGMVILFVLIG